MKKEGEQQMTEITDTAPDLMGQAIKTYMERSAVYGDSYFRHGEIMKALFPDGVELKTQEDHNRWGAINMIVSKLCRYCTNFSAPHLDSIHDQGVYCFILEEIDTKKLNNEGKK